MGHAQDLNPIIEAAGLLRENKNLVFLLIGEGVQAGKWRQKVTESSLDNVRFLPLQPKSAYPSVVAASDVGLVPLTVDLRTPVVPGKLMDFMAGGRPVIATVNPDGDTKKIIEEAQCGFSCLPGDAQGVADAISVLYQDPSLADRMGSKGRSYAEKHFSLEFCASQYEALFKRICAINKMEK